VATTITPRLQVTTWSADSDPFNRAQMQDSHTNLEARAGVFLSGTLAARPAAGASNTRGLYLATDQNAPTGILYYSDGSNWVALNQFGSVSALTVGGAGANGTASTVSRSDHVHPLPGYGVVGEIANVAAAKAAGTLDKFARADHVHQISNGVITGPMLANGALDDARLFVSGTIPGTAIQAGTIPGEAFNTSPVPAGMIFPYASTVAPTGYLLCDGSAVSRSTYSALFGLVGTAFGAGNGTTTFNVPDLRGRSIFGLDNMGGTDAGRLSVANTIGGTGGTETVTLTAAQMPSHTHTIDHDHGAVTSSADASHTHSIAHDHASVTSSPEGSHSHTQANVVSALFGHGQSVADAGNAVFGLTTGTTSTEPAHTHTVDLPNFSGTSGAGSSHTHSVDLPSLGGNSGSAGSGGSHNNMPPYMLLSWVIKT
jgi:microcystin-dependent protein